MTLEATYRGRVSGKVAIVTGATSGIGRATAVLLAREGASVVAAGRRVERGEDLVAQLASEHLSGHFVATDVSRHDDVVRLVAETVARFERLDIVVNNAGVLIFRSVEESTEQEWDQVLDTNLKSVYLMTHEAIPHLRRSGGGAIVNVSSVHAYATMGQYAAYAASKGGVLALTRQMAIDCVKDRIRVNALIVGGVDTEMSRGHFSALGQTLDDAGFVSDERVLGRVGRPEEIASAILFLASPESAFINGSPFIIDGGLLAKL